MVLLGGALRDPSRLVLSTLPSYLSPSPPRLPPGTSPVHPPHGVWTWTTAHVGNPSLFAPGRRGYRYRPTVGCGSLQGSTTTDPWDTPGGTNRNPTGQSTDGTLGQITNGTLHGGSATFCFCADPCTHSVQDLNRLTCFCNSWNHGIWRFPFSVAHKVRLFLCDLGVVNGVLGVLVSALPLVVPPLHYPAPFCSLPDFQRMSHDWYWWYGNCHGDFCRPAKAPGRCVLFYRLAKALSVAVSSGPAPKTDFNASTQTWLYGPQWPFALLAVLLSSHGSHKQSPCLNNTCCSFATFGTFCIF